VQAMPSIARFTFFLSIFILSTNAQETTASLENVTKTISNLLKGYDIRLRPNFGGLNISSPIPDAIE
jgi:acetaldehyde dehydrogenase (acetylating)